MLEEPASEIWKRYRFEHNHVAKYLGASIHTTPRGGISYPASSQYVTAVVDGR